jgi:hypothetical protein
MGALRPVNKVHPVEPARGWEHQQGNSSTCPRMWAFRSSSLDLHEKPKSRTTPPRRRRVGVNYGSGRPRRKGSKRVGGGTDGGDTCEVALGGSGASLFSTFPLHPAESEVKRKTSPCPRDWPGQVEPEQICSRRIRMMKQRKAEPRRAVTRPRSRKPRHRSAPTASGPERFGVGVGVAL